MGREEEGDVFLMVQVVHQVEEARTGLLVEVRRGFVRQHQFRLRNDGPGHGDALLLAAGKLLGKPVDLLAQAHFLQDARRPVAALFLGNALEEQDILHVLQRGEDRDQVIGLEYEADFVQADVRKLPGRHPVQVAAGHGQ